MAELQTLRSEEIDSAATENQSSRGRSVTSKVVAVLDAFSPSSIHAPAIVQLSLKELALRTGLPTSTTYRLASELVGWGGLARVRGGGYRIGPRIVHLGSVPEAPPSLRQVARPVMCDLHEASRETVHLAVLDGRSARYAERVGSLRAVRATPRRAGRIPLHATGAGKILLAYGPPALTADLIRAGLKRYTPHTVVDPDELREVLAAVRQIGIAVADQELALGSLSIAAPITDGAGTVVAALALVLPADSGELLHWGPAVRTAAISISRAVKEQMHRSAQPDPICDAPTQPRY